MTNYERLKSLRHKLNLSVNEMAHLLGLHGANGGDKVREIERGARDMSGVLLNTMRYIEQSAFSDLDAFAVCKGVGAAAVYVTHNHWPRFVLKPTGKPTQQRQAIASGAHGRELVIINATTAAILQWIDEPINDHKPLLQSAIDLIKANYEQ